MTGSTPILRLGEDRPYDLPLWLGILGQQDNLAMRSRLCQVFCEPAA